MNMTSKKLIKIKKGLDLPIQGKPDQNNIATKKITKVAIVGSDYPGMKPAMEVQIGDKVKKGQILFTDRKNPGVNFAAPAGGKVIEINRGAKRLFQSLVIEIEKNEKEESFKSFRSLNKIKREDIVSHINSAGLWTSFIERPFAKIPTLDSIPNAIFINTMDTNPLAYNPELVIKEESQSFTDGLTIISGLTEGNTYLIKSPNSDIPLPKDVNIEVREFEGPHPSGLPGTHIHFIDPAGKGRKVWQINYYDVIAIGKLFKKGILYTDRMISLAGPSVKEPKLIKARAGASIDEVTLDEIIDESNRIISGSILSGYIAIGPFSFLGKYHHQVSVIPEGGGRSFLRWFNLFLNKHSVKNVNLNKNYEFDTSLNGGKRAIVPVGSYEKVMPLDILPVYFLRAICVDDFEAGEKLGLLELAEEDMALLTYVCPSKNDYGTILRRNLTIAEKEG